ncbi:Nucleolar protein 11 [Desmophyllum pertusum]|uniref:Nucleolar protein 11 n=1 Tax=Desmophyllum pertusum TaxID=174260 RepID=A0A9W9ZJ39_9CNID|nr:Nucleolar protein 11 [Desmophyllum pertusum]
MADLREPFELCKVLQNSSLIGISKHTGSDNVLLTFSDRGVLVYNLQHQKLINSWSVEQRDEVTSAAVHNPIDNNFLMAVNKTEMFMWKETDPDFKSCQRIQSDKNIFSLHVWSNQQSDPLVVFEDGSSMFLADFLSTSESRKVKRRRSTRSSHDFSLVWSCVFHYQKQPYSGTIRMHVPEKNKYTLNVTNHGTSDHVNPKSKTMEFELTPPTEDAELLCCCVNEEGHQITSYWSNGALCITELETALQLGTNENMLALSCRTIHRLQPLHSEGNKDKGSVALTAIYTDHVCLCGSSEIDGKLKDVIMVWNIKYGTLQSWQTLDKITEKQSSILSHVRSNGACCVCCIPGFICVGFRRCVAACQFSIDTCSLASALGQLDSTAKFLRDDSFTPELLVTPKLARPGEALQGWSELIVKEDQVEKEVLQKLTDPSKTPTLDKFATELKKYMTLKLSKQDDKAKSGKAGTVPFHGKFGKKTEVLSQHFITSVLSRCTNEKKFWARKSVSELVKTKCVPSSCSKELLDCVVEKNDLELLKECIKNIKGISEDTVVLCVRHILRLDDATLPKGSKKSVTEELQLDDDFSQMPLDKTRAKYLCSVLSYPVNDIFLQASLKKLSFEDVILLLKFLMYLMHRGLTGFDDEVDCSTLKFPQVLDWTGLVLNAHYTQWCSCLKPTNYWSAVTNLWLNRSALAINYVLWKVSWSILRKESLYPKQRKLDLTA